MSMVENERTKLTFGPICALSSQFILDIDFRL
jgi:hypothetical protein